MAPKAANKKEFLCRFKVKGKEKPSNTREFLNKHYDKLLQCFYPMASKVINATLVELRGIKETNQVIITPTRFTVDFNKQFANIFVLTQ